LTQHFVRIALGYWRGRTRTTAWLLSFGFLTCLLMNLWLALAVNRWSKVFFDAIQFRQFDGIMRSLEELVVLVAGTALVAVATIQCRMRLQVGWRFWMMQSLIQRWLYPEINGDVPVSIVIDNPEARIADDVRIALELSVDLAGGVINMALGSAAFIVVLWNVGGSHELFGVTIPGYLVIAVFIYVAITTFVMSVLARPLVRSVEEKAAAEGDFRYALTEARLNLTGKALTESRIDTEEDIRNGLDHLAKKWRRVIRGQTKIVLLNSANYLLAPSVPLLLCAPKYLAGMMTLGDLIQAAAAFVQVQTSLNWLTDNALSLANWSASAHRVASLDLDMQRRSPSVVNQDGHS
jgi:putative ATP-binding cassette transporter